MKYRPKSRSSVRLRTDLRLPGDYPWKVLNKLLIDLKEFLPSEDWSLASLITRNRDFDAYLLLPEAWALQCMPPGGTSLGEFRAKYLISSVLKKFQFDTDRKLRTSVAIEGFYAAERACQEFNLDKHKLLIGSDPFAKSVLAYAKGFLQRLLGVELPHHEKLLRSARHGPGATLDTKSGRISTYNKFENWPYSCTASASRYARFAIATDQRWMGALLNDYRDKCGIPQHFPINMEAFWTSVIRFVPGNRVTFVPKDSLKERTIAIEPTLNLYLQLGVDGFIRNRLKRYGIDLNDQATNQELARIGSFGWPDYNRSYATIDLSAASDSISLKLCEILLPADWYSYLLALRSPSGEMGTDVISYEKISSMGNGYTFVLESAIFAALTYAAIKADGGTVDAKAFNVYGDDIIVRKKHFASTVKALRLAGFTTNTDKTFSEGHFRESCGSDWFNGRPVRPVFLKKTPSSVMELFLDLNRFRRHFHLRFGIEESETLRLLEKWIPKDFLKFKGPFSDEDFDLYRHVPEPPQGSWRNYLYKYKRLVIRPLPQPGPNFHFRKLMNRLEPTVQSTGEYPRRSPSGKGSSFTVVYRNGTTVGTTYSVSCNWRSSYTE